MTVGHEFQEKFTGIKLSREELLELIEKNNGPEGLNLSGMDLSGIRLGAKALKQVRIEKGLDLDTCPAWLFPETQGINLKGVDLSFSVISGADLSKCCLRGADLRGAHLDHVDFIDADLCDTILFDATMDNSVFDDAKLHGANIFGTNFYNATISQTI